MALDALFAFVGEDDAGLLAAVDLGFSGEFASEEVDGTAGSDERFGQAEDVDKDGTVELGAGGVFVDLVEGEEALVAEAVELVLGLDV